MMADVKQMPVDRISKTGAVAGDRVKCVSSKDPKYRAGETHEVIMHFGRAHIAGKDHEIKSASGKVKEVYNLPLEGFGAMWVKV
jgi:hypothetical protein